MQTRRWSQLYLLVREVARELPRGGRAHPDWLIVLVLLYAAFNHRPVSWAVQRGHWPIWFQALAASLPSNSAMSRRLRSPGVVRFLSSLLERAQGGRALPALVRAIDGMSLEIRRHSRDREAGFGQSAGCKAKGYKLHVVLDSSGRIVAWAIEPMNASEKIVARRLLGEAGECLYVVADNGYDSNPLHRIVSAHGGQLVSPRRRNVGPLRRGRETPGRLRSDRLLRGGSTFGQDLLNARRMIERFFGNADSHAEALGDLPGWVRGLGRVTRWVHAKLIINALRVTNLRQAA
jgi:IS5 family transposase